MITDAYVKVICDTCRYSESYELTAIAGNAYDMRYLEEELERDGWSVDGDTTICDNCQEDDDDDDK